MTTEFVKYEALGNDYVIVDTTVTDLPASVAVARLLSDRHFGVGADGVIFGPYGEGDDFGLRVFNPDGSECFGSGNGLRIFAHHLREQGHVRSDRFTMRAAAGLVEARIVDLGAAVVEVTLGSATTLSDAIPASGPSRAIVRERLTVDGRDIDITCVSVGTPHCVVIEPGADREHAEQWGPRIGTHPMFPQKTNVEFVSVVDRSAVSVEVWERGAGYTLASGAGACAAATAARMLGLVDQDVTVRMPGGDVQVSVRPGNVVALRGEVRKVMQGTFADGFRERARAADAGDGAAR
ncbi:diaminopimelate epimerase [Streptomyces goshikiensis]|uniref:diaminopimelate epimerase n=1 Tax=Streptomyces goshikiensis TaxID=1942 RepID=UPI0036A96657